MKKKKYYLGVYSDTFHIDLLLLLYILLIFAIYFVTMNPRNLLLWISILVIIVTVLQVGRIACVDIRGVYIYRLFKKKLFLQWDKIMYWGTISKTVLGKKKITYVYFSQKPLMCAPWEKMPNMNDELIYFTYQSYLLQILKQVGKRDVAVHLPNNTGSILSTDMRRKVIGSIIALGGASVVAVVYFVINQPIVLLFLVLPFVHMVFLMINTVDWSKTG